MRLDIALGIEAGDTVYNCFREPMKVVGKTKFYNPSGRLDRIEFFVVGSITSEYNYTDIYLANLEDESDEETSWVHWASFNKDILINHDLGMLRQVYIAAFANGCEYKRNIHYQEMMQK